MTDGQYTEDDARRIFARAAERQHAVAARGERLSADDLQAIGAEVGLDPAHVAAAVAELEAGAAFEPVVREGIDLTPRRVRVLPGALTDAAWEAIVQRLRRTFGAKGIPTAYGQVREWTSGPGSTLHVTAEPVADGTRVVIEASRAEEVDGMNGFRSGPYTALALAAGLSLLFGFGDFGATVWVAPALTLLMGLAVYVWMRVYYRRWSEARQREFDAVLDDVDLILRATPAPDAAAAVPSEAARIDPAHLDAEAEARPATRRTRTR